jgi:hypothetical protein
MFRRPKKYTNLPEPYEVKLLMIDLAELQANTMQNKNPGGASLMRRTFNAGSTFKAMHDMAQLTLWKGFWNV